MDKMNEQLLQAKRLVKLSAPNNKLERLYGRMAHVLHGPVSSLQIAKHTGVNHATILRLRQPYGNQVRSMSHATLGTVLCLADYRSDRHCDLAPALCRQYYIGLACIDLDVDPTEYTAMVAVVMDTVTNVTALSKRIGVSREKLECLRNRKQSVLNLRIADLSKLVDYYYRLADNGMIASSKVTEAK